MGGEGRGATGRAEAVGGGGRAGVARAALFGLLKDYENQLYALSAALRLPARPPWLGLSAAWPLCAGSLTSPHHLQPLPSPLPFDRPPLAHGPLDPLAHHGASSLQLSARPSSRAALIPRALVPSVLCCCCRRPPPAAGRLLVSSVLAVATSSVPFCSAVRPLSGPSASNSPAPC